MVKRRQSAGSLGSGARPISSFSQKPSAVPCVAKGNIAVQSEGLRNLQRLACSAMQKEIMYTAAPEIFGASRFVLYYLHL